MEKISKKTYMNYELTKWKMGILSIFAFMSFIAGNNLFYNTQVNYNTLIGLVEVVISVVVIGLIYLVKVNGDEKKK